MQVLSFNQVKRNIIPEVMRVERETWPPEIQASEAKFQSRAEIFPQGFQLGFIDGKLWGVSTAQIIKFQPNNPCTSWEKITDNGWIKESHNPEGNALYVISIGVSPLVSRRGLGTALLEAQKKLTRQLSLKWLVLGSRVPDFAAWHSQHPHSTIEQFLKTKQNNESLDSLIRFYERGGLKIIKIVPNYMEDDPESENYGVIMCWLNEKFP